MILDENEKPDNRIWWYLTVGILFSFAIGWIMNQNYAYRAINCAEKGGIYLTTHYNSVCLKKESVIQLNTSE